MIRSPRVVESPMNLTHRSTSLPSPPAEVQLQKLKAVTQHDAVLFCTFSNMVHVNVIMLPVASISTFCMIFFCPHFESKFRKFELFLAPYGLTWSEVEGWDGGE